MAFFAETTCAGAGLVPRAVESFVLIVTRHLGISHLRFGKLLDNDGVPLLDKEENRFLHARPGDMFMVPYQCEVCHFQNIQHWNPFTGDPRDDETLK